MEKSSIRRKGRPSLPVSQRRINLVKVYFTDDEISRLDEVRSTSPRARYTRERVLLKQQKQGHISPQIIVALARVGNNINQIARTLNEGDRVTDRMLSQQYETLKKLLDSITGK